MMLDLTEAEAFDASQFILKQLNKKTSYETSICERRFEFKVLNGPIGRNYYVIDHILEEQCDITDYGTW